MNVGFQMINVPVFWAVYWVCFIYCHFRYFGFVIYTIRLLQLNCILKSLIRFTISVLIWWIFFFSELHKLPYLSWLSWKTPRSLQYYILIIRFWFAQPYCCYTSRTTTCLAEYHQAVVPSHIDMDSSVLEQSVISHSYLQVSRLRFCYSSW